MREMTEEELEIIELIRKSNNPQMALYKALCIIADFVNSNNKEDTSIS